MTGGISSCCTSPFFAVDCVKPYLANFHYFLFNSVIECCKKCFDMMKNGSLKIESNKVFILCYIIYLNLNEASVQ